MKMNKFGSPLSLFVLWDMCVCLCVVCVCVCVRACVRACVCVCVPEHVIASSLQISMSVVLASTTAPNTALTYMGPMAVRARLGTHWRMTGGTALVGASVGCCGAKAALNRLSYGVYFTIRSPMYTYM